MSAPVAPAGTGTSLPWRLEDIDLSAIDVARVRSAFKPREYAALRTREILRRHSPLEMAGRMLLEPIDLPPALTRALVPVLTRTADLVFI